MDPNNPTVFDKSSGDQQSTPINKEAVATLTVDLIDDLIGTAVGALVPEAELPSFIRSFGTNLATSTPTNIQNTLNALNGTGSINDVRDAGQLVRSSYINTNIICKWLLTPISY